MPTQAELLVGSIYERVYRVVFVNLLMKPHTSGSCYSSLDLEELEFG